MPTPQPSTPVPERGDDELLRSYVRTDDVAAMDELVRRHADSLRAFLRGWADTDAAVEDLFQEVWSRVIRKPERFHGGNFRAWLLRIARNLVIDRHRVRTPDLILDAPTSEDENASPMVDCLSDEDAVLPDEVVARKDLCERMLAAVRCLPAPLREVFLLRAEDISFSDIASRLRIPLNTALGRMRYAILRLRRDLSIPTA